MLLIITLSLRAYELLILSLYLIYKLTTNKNKNTIYYSVPLFFKNIDMFYLTITTRGNRYNVLLGGK